MYLIYAIIGMVGFGLSDFFISSLSKVAGQYKGMFWNTLFMLLYLLVILLIWGNYRILILPISDYLVVFLAAAIFTLGGLSFYKGTQVGKLAILSPLAASYPIPMIILATIFLHEKLATWQLGAIFLVIIGTLLVSTNIKELNKTHHFATEKAVPYGILSALLWGTAFVLTGDLTNRIGWLPTNLLMTIVSLMLLTIITWVKERGFLLKKNNIYPLAALIGIFSTMGYLGYSLGVSTSFVSVVGTIVAAAPLITITLAIVFFKEKLFKTQFIGIGMIVAGVVLLSYLG